MYRNITIMDQDVFLKRIDYYNFILSILVVFVHALNLADSNDSLRLLAYNGGSLPVQLENFFSNSLGQMAVPGFFMVSGYLFFRSLSDFAEILPKWHRRIHSLIIPYLSWNFLYYILCLIMRKADFSAPEFLKAVFLYSCNPVFWYLFQLICITAYAPVLFVFLKNRVLSFVLCALLLISLYHQQKIFPLANEDALLYYFSGAMLSRFHWPRLRGIRFWPFLLFIIAHLLRLLSLYLIDPGLFRTSAVILRLSMVFCLAFLISRVKPVSKEKSGLIPLIPVLSREERFILFASHYLLIRFEVHALSMLQLSGLSVFSGDTGTTIMLFLYFLLPLFSVLFAVLLSRFLKNIWPFGWKILSGGKM